LEAAIGVGQLNRSEQIISRRKEIADTYNNAFSDLIEYMQLPSCPSDRTHSYMLYGIVLKNEKKQKFVNYLENLNIETRDLLPLINQPIYKELFGNIEDNYPIAKWINNSGFYIGCHSYMNDSEINFVIEAIRNYFKK